MRKILFVLFILFSTSYAEEDVLLDVIDLKFAKSIKNKQPVSISNSFPSDIKKVYCWTKIRAFKVPTYVIHEWYYKDKHMATVKLVIKSGIFRTWSSKKILPNWKGKWKVYIKDELGNIIHMKQFIVK